jgi:hypothetical protein
MMQITELDVLKLDVDLLTTDTGNKEWLILEYGDKLAYCDALGGWLSWTDSRWEVNESPTWHYAEEIGRALKQKAAAHSNRDEADRIWEHAQQTLDEPRQRRMLSKASHDSRISKRANECSHGGDG